MQMTERVLESRQCTKFVFDAISDRLVDARGHDSEKKAIWLITHIACTALSAHTSFAQSIPWVTICCGQPATNIRLCTLWQVRSAKSRIYANKQMMAADGSISGHRLYPIRCGSIVYLQTYCILCGRIFFDRESDGSGGRSCRDYALSRRESWIFLSSFMESYLIVLNFFWWPIPVHFEPSCI